MTSDEHEGGKGPGSTGSGRLEGSAPGRSPIVFVSDASAEVERIGDTLRAAGYVVVDVPMSMLSSRVAAQRPNVVLIDVDADGVLDELARIRKLPGSGAIDFVYIGRGDGIVKNAEDALSNDGSAFFVRPVDIGSLVRKIEALTGGPLARPEARPSTPPPSLAIGRSAQDEKRGAAASNRASTSSGPPRSSRGPSSSRIPASQQLARDPIPPSDRPSTPSLPAPGVRTPGPPLPMSTTSLADLVDAPRSFASFGTVSHELQQLLADAELRAEVMSSPDVALPSPEEEIEAVLPADVLASLDEPIEGDEDEEPGGPEGAPRTGPGAPSHDRDGGTGAHAKGTTSGGSRQQTTGSHVRAPSTGAQTNERRASSETPPKSTTGGGITTTPTSMTGRPRTTDAVPRSLAFETRSDLRAEVRRIHLEEGEQPSPQPGQSSQPGQSPQLGQPPQLGQLPPRPSSWHPPPSIPSAAPPPGDLRGPSVKPAAPVTGAVVLGPFDARRFFAEAIARRATGALCFESEGVVRRIVMREGDLVAAASGGENESLVHFLAARGELSRDEAPRLAAKIPPYGRHAGAALVAHGWLRQDQLWQVLRAHAEWIAGAILRLARGTAQLEPDPPGRLRGEPSVFGAATGAEIFVDLVRRSVSLEDALDRLGGEGSRVTDGPNHGLLAECNLPAQDIELLHRARGGTIADLLARATDGEIVAVLHALALLGVVEVVPAPDFGRTGREGREGREGRGRSDARGDSAADAEVAALDEDAIRARVRARLELVEEGDYFAVLGVTRDATGYEIRRAFIELRRAFEPSRILTPRLLDLTDDVRKIIVVIEEAYEILRDNARRERYRRAIDARPE
jgi:hypothetical protein